MSHDHHHSPCSPTHTALSPLPQHIHVNKCLQLSDKYHYGSYLSSCCLFTAVCKIHIHAPFDWEKIKKTPKIQVSVLNSSPMDESTSRNSVCPITTSWNHLLSKNVISIISWGRHYQSTFLDYKLGFKSPKGLIHWTYLCMTFWELHRWVDVICRPGGINCVILFRVLELEVWG